MLALSSGCFTYTGHRWDRIVDVSARRSLSEIRLALTPNGVYAWVGGTTATLAQGLSSAQSFVSAAGN